MLCVSAVVWAADVATVVFVAGDVRINGQQARVGDSISEGRSLATGKDGYLYLETTDRGFFILRPNSQGKIAVYKVDATDPANSRFKLELESGIARHISGEAAKASRQNFRFNTPVAAIGIRGTDFTVYADTTVTRVMVNSGGVVVSPISTSCKVSGFGPCEGAFSKELFASKLSQILQIQRGHSAPILLQGAEHLPDVISPPRSNEPAVASPGSSAHSVIPSDAGGTKEVDLSPAKTQLLEQAGKNPLLIWGRWQALLNQDIQVDPNALQASYNLIATNDYFALLRRKIGDWAPLAQSSMAFNLQESQAVIVNEANNLTVPVRVENGQLNVDFAKSTFFTKIDLVNQSERIQLQSSGEVSANGRLYGGNQFLRPNNMYVSGALASDNSSAAYLFQARLDAQRFATGVTAWGK